MIQIDMEMPQNCNECRFHEYGTFCMASLDKFACAPIANTTGITNIWRPARCPLKEVHSNTVSGGNYNFVTNGDGS
ncbi:MAG: hypothetical protein IKN54_04435 [Lachnospiraceae bacterium]|nr:hypothetical protein [Lachnospiraceae bacterium]